MNPFDLLLSDRNVAPAFRRLFANPSKGILDVALGKAAPRRFTGEPQTGFGDIGTVGSERFQEVRAEEHADHQREERARQIDAGL